MEKIKKRLRIVKYFFSSRCRWQIQCLKRYVVNLANKILGFSFINIGAGRDCEMLGWWTGDYQTGFVFNESTKLPFADNVIDFAYSSMFFEHIDDITAKNLLSEIYRTLKPGGILRIVVPDYMLYIRMYRERDFNFFYDDKNDNFSTWKAFGVPLDLEHLLTGMISSIHNLPHVMVSFPFQECFTRTPPPFLLPVSNET